MKGRLKGTWKKSVEVEGMMVGLCNNGVVCE